MKTAVTSFAVGKMTTMLSTCCHISKWPFRCKQLELYFYPIKGLEVNGGTLGVGKKWIKFHLGGLKCYPIKELEVSRETLRVQKKMDKM